MLRTNSATFQSDAEPGPFDAASARVCRKHSERVQNVWRFRLPRTGSCQAIPAARGIAPVTTEGDPSGAPLSVAIGFDFHSGAAQQDSGRITPSADKGYTAAGSFRVPASTEQVPVVSATV
jgi:hypothetical protein